MPIEKDYIEGYEITKFVISDINDETQKATLSQVPQEYTNKELAINALHTVILQIKKDLKLTETEIKELFLKLI